MVARNEKHLAFVIFYYYHLFFRMQTNKPFKIYEAVCTWKNEGISQLNFFSNFKILVFVSRVPCAAFLNMSLPKIYV